MPAGAGPVWGIWCDLDATRPFGGWGDPLPLSYGEIEAYGRSRGFRLRPWEVGWVRAMDMEYFSLLDERARAKKDEEEHARRTKELQRGRTGP